MPSEEKDATRERLLTTAIDIFGRRGFEGASTRELAAAAGANLQAIRYYFDNKEGLYLAAAEHLVSLIDHHVAATRQRVGEELAALRATATPLDPARARILLEELAVLLVSIFATRESESWARFLIREQMEPTAAFTCFYNGIMQPMLAILRELIGTLTRTAPDSEETRLRSLSFAGNFMIFRVAHAAVLKELQWKTIGEPETAILRNHALRLVNDIAPRSGDMP